MLNNLLKTSYMLVLAIFLAACGGEGTPTGGNKDNINVGKDQVPKDSDLAQELEKTEPGALMPNTQISVHFTDGSESPIIDYANQAAWKAGFNIDFTNTPLDKISMSNHIENPDFNIETKFYTKRGVLFLTEGRITKSKLTAGIHFYLTSIKMIGTPSAPKDGEYYSITPSGQGKYPAGTTLDDLTTVFTVATYTAGGKTYNVVSPTMYIKFPADAPQPTTL